MMNNKLVYAVYSKDYTGESSINVFEDEMMAHIYMIDDRETVIKTLKEDGYEPDSAENDDTFEVWVKDTGIYYEWSVYQSEYHKHMNDMNEEKVSTLLNREVLEPIQDDPVRQILKSILFSSSTTVDWEQAYTFIMTFMPELNLYDGYKIENMKE